MNFLTWMEGEKTELELKYCERCGGLWLRARGADEVYYRGCRAHMAAVPHLPGEVRKRPRLPRPNPEDIQGGIEIQYLQGIAEFEARP